ncbi:MAG: hypothetical protein EOS77_31770, partial [Mesorhizobium sp.]
STTSRPWVVAFAMHPFSYDDIAAALRAFSLETEPLERFRQRQCRFSTPTQRQAILKAMAKLGMKDRL